MKSAKPNVVRRTIIDTTTHRVFDFFFPFFKFVFAIFDISLNKSLDLP